MTENDRPLPTPPRSRFGRDSREEAGPPSDMISDRMALAAAQGRLEEFLQHEIPEGDHARTLARMMLGMSGMVPIELPEGAAPGGPAAPPPDAQATAPPPEVPPEVLAAIEQGDVTNLMGILRAEHQRRAGLGGPGDDAPQTSEARSAGQPAAGSPGGDPAAPAVAPAAGRAGIDAAIVDELIRISADNDVTVDWLMLRAVRLYVEEHRRTGRL